MSRRGNRRALARNTPSQDNPSAQSRSVERRLESIEMSFQGPIPPPGMLREYDNVIEGGAERLLSIFERQVAHRHDLERRRMSLEAWRTYLGIAGAFVLAAGALVVSAVLALNGAALEGLATTVTAIGGLAGVFVYAQHNRKEERIEKAKVVAGRR